MTDWRVAIVWPRSPEVKATIRAASPLLAIQQLADQFVIDLTEATHVDAQRVSK
jgi:hypothetical protein